MLFIELEITEENDDKVNKIIIATEKNITEDDKKILQSTLQNLIYSLNVKLLKTPTNPGEFSAQFNIGGKKVISRDFDHVGYAEELLTTLNKIAVVSPEKCTSGESGMTA